MNENLNLIEILKDCTKGTKLYSPMTGELTFIDIFRPSNDSCYVELLRSNDVSILFDSQGRYFTDAPDGECLLFPSKNQRDWGKFNILKPCPFCGKEVKLYTGEEWWGEKGAGGYYAVGCGFSKGGCESISGFKPTPKEAIELWNNRINN